MKLKIQTKNNDALVILLLFKNNSWGVINCTFIILPIWLYCNIICNKTFIKIIRIIFKYIAYLYLEDMILSCSFTVR